MAFMFKKKKGAPIGNKNAAGHHNGHFHSGALKRVAVGTAKLAGGALATGAVFAAAGVAAINMIDNSLSEMEKGSRSVTTYDDMGGRTVKYYRKPK